jgi:hypothetical protein
MEIYQKDDFVVTLGQNFRKMNESEKNKTVILKVLSKRDLEDIVHNK